MNACLKPVTLELSDGNIRDSHIDLRGTLGLFPDDALDGDDESAAARPIRLSVAGETIETDIDPTKAIFRRRDAIRRFFETENLTAGDLVLIERDGERAYHLRKASKRGFRYYL